MPGLGYGAGYLFTYPAADGAAINDDWDYQLRIASQSVNGGRDVEKNRKHVWIEVRDRDERVLLHEETFLDCGSIEASRTWDPFSSLHLTLYERASEDAAERRTLLDREYEYNTSTRDFERVR